MYETTKEGKNITKILFPSTPMAYGLVEFTGHWKNTDIEFFKNKEERDKEYARRTKKRSV